MKAIILAGGLGTRLYPITKAVSKQLLPVYDKPLIYYPLSVLMLAGIKEILIISTPYDKESFINLFGDGSALGLNISYSVQPEPKGIAQAFLIGKDFIGKDSVALILGDNIFYGQSFTNILNQTKNQINKNNGASVFGYYVNNPQAYGVLEFDEKGRCTGITEKPADPKSNYVVPGLYFFDNNVIEIASKLKFSSRGELEITDILNEYLKKNSLTVNKLGRGMTWLDAGTYDGLLDAGNYIATIQKRQGLYVSCIEEIAYQNGWISKEQLLTIAKDYKTEYGRYLENVAES